jgi:uncharacterized membrane protein
LSRAGAVPKATLVTALLFLVAGVLHFVIPTLYVRIMPPYLPSPLALVYLSGVAEIVGGIGLLVPTTRKAAGVGLILLLVAVFPAHVEMLRLAQREGAPAWFIGVCLARMPFQVVLMWWVWRVARAGRDLVP